MQVGERSWKLSELIPKTDEIRDLIRAGQSESARQLMQDRSTEEQAVLVALSEDPEEMLSLTGPGGGYSQQVVNLLPSEVLTNLIVPDTDYLRYNIELIKALSPTKFQGLISETLDPMDYQDDRRQVSWEWLEVLAELDDVDKRGELLRAVEIQVLAEALRDVVHLFRFDDILHFRRLTDTRQPYYLFERPGDYLEDLKVAAVLDALHDAAPEVVAEMISDAWKDLETE